MLNCLCSPGTGGFSMDITLFLFCTCSVFAAIAIVRAKIKLGKRLSHAGKRKLVTLRDTVTRRALERRIRWIDAAELSRLIRSDSDLTVFHLIDFAPPAGLERPMHGELFVTLPQLEEALPWMPDGSRFAIYRPGGIDPALSKRLATMVRGRTALLVVGVLPSAAGNFEEMAGELCN